MTENESESGAEGVVGDTRAYARLRGSRKRAKRRANQARQAQVDLVRAVQRAAEHGVTDLPALPAGVRASTGAMLESMLTASGGAKAYALAQRLITEALDDSAPRSLDAARIVLERSEDPRVRRTETTQRSARIVLNIDQPQGDGGTLELGSGPIHDGTSSSSSPLPLSPPPSPPLSLPPPLPLPSPALSLPAPLSVDDVNVHSPSAAAAPDSLAERVAKLEASQEEMLSLLRSLASRIVGG